MVSPFRNPFDNEPTERSSRWSFFKTKQQQIKDRRDAQRRQALANQQAVFQRQNFTPTPIQDINVDNLFEGAQSEALIAQANANNPNPALREESKGWFSTLMQKWDDKTVEFAGSSLNPFNAVINLYNPSAARQIELKKMRYKKEYIASGLTDKEAGRKAQRAAWRETDISQVKIAGKTIDPIKFMGEVVSDPTNLVFFGAGTALKAAVKGGAAIGRKQLKLTGAKFADTGKTKTGNIKDMVLEDELITNPGFYWQKQAASELDKTFFQGGTFAQQTAARKTFRKYLYEPEKLTEKNLRDIYNDTTISNALSRYKAGEISTESYARKMTYEKFEELYKAPIVKTNKQFLSNPKSDYQYLALQGTADSADYITDLKAMGYALANTKSKLMAPLRFGWKYIDPAPFQVNSKLGRALLIHGARENDNKVLVANAVRKQKEQWKKLSLGDDIDLNNLPEEGAFEALINPKYDFAANGKNKEALDYWGTFLEEAFDDTGKLAPHIRATKAQEEGLRKILDGWGEHATHLVENGVYSPQQMGLAVKTAKDGSLYYEQDLLQSGRRYVGHIVESMGDRELRNPVVNFTRASGERPRKYASDFTNALDDEIAELTRDQAREMGIKYLNNPISVYDIKSGEIMDRINDVAFINRMKILGDKRFQTSDSYLAVKKKIADVEDTFNSIVKTIEETSFNPKATGKKTFLAAGVNEFGTELKTILQNVDADIAPEIEGVTKKMLEVLDGPMNQRARQLENVENELATVITKMDEEGAIISELRRTLNKGLPALPPLDLEKSTRSRIKTVLGGASHKIMEGKGEFDVNTLLNIRNQKILEDVVGSAKIDANYPIRGKDIGTPISARKIVLPKNIDELRQLRKDLKNVQQKMVMRNYSKAVIANVNETERTVFRLIKEHNATSKLKVNRKELDPIKDVLNKLDELQLDNPLVVQKINNQDLFKNLNDLVRGYTNLKSRRIADKFKQQLIRESKIVVNTLDDSIRTKNELAEKLIDAVGSINNNPELAKKYFGNYFTKKGTFRQSVMKDIDTHFPAISDILVKFQQDPQYLNDYKKGLISLQNDLLPIVKQTLAKHHEDLSKIKLSYYKRKDPEGIRKTSLFGKQISGIEETQRLKDANLTNVNLRNGIPTKELENYLFSNADKTRIEKFFGQKQGQGFASKFGALLETAGTVGDIIRLMKVGYDLGAPLIQGLPLLVTNPAGWGKASWYHYRTFAQSKEAVAGYFAKNSHVIDEMIESGVEISGEGLDYYSAFKDGTLFNQVLEGTDKQIAKIPILGRIVDKNAGLSGITSRFNDAFDVFGDIARIEMYQALKNVAIKKSIGGGVIRRTTTESAVPDGTDLGMMQLADTVNKMTGVFNSRARGANRSTMAFDRSWAFFSPRYTRASTALIADALIGGGSNVTGYAARQTLFRMLNAGMIAYVGQVQLRRMMEEEAGVPEEQRTKAYLDPRPVAEGGDGGKFMKIRIGSEGRESYVGIGGFWTGFLKLASNIALDPAFRGDKSDSPLFMTDEVGKGTTASLLSNPIIQWLRGRQPPTSGLMWDLSLGHDFIGNPLETKTDWGKHLGKQAVPFWVEHGFMTGDENKWDRPAGMFAELSGFQANEVSDWQNLQDLKDELAMKHHGVMWDDLPILQQEEIKMATVGSSDDIQVIEDKIYDERKQYPLGDKAQKVMPEWFRIIDDIQADFDEKAVEIDSALDNNEIDVAMYVKHMNAISREKRLSQQQLKQEERFKPLYKNFEYQTIDQKTGVADYFFNEYMNLISDSAQFSLLPQNLQDIGLMDSDMIDWDAKAQAIANFEDRVGPQVMEYINKRMNTKPRVGDVPHPVYEEYLRGREKYLNDYYQRVEQEALALRGDEAIEQWNSYKKSSYPVREEIERGSPLIKQILRDINKARQLLRKNNPDLDAFLYRFNVGGTTTLLHSYNKSDYRKGELAQPFPMERYTPGFTTD